MIVYEENGVELVGLKRLLLVPVLAPLKWKWWTETWSGL
jgi:hypothetical protein